MRELVTTDGWAGPGWATSSNVDANVEFNVKRGAQPAENLCEGAGRSGSVTEVPANGPGPQAEQEAGSIEARALGTGGARMYSRRMGPGARVDTSRGD